MRSIDYLKRDVPADAFEGTAEYYSRYSIPYPKVLIGDLIKRTGSGGDGKLLDIVSGPGRLTIPLAPFFSCVIANDRDAEMVAVGKSEAEKQGFSNIEWVIGRAEELEIEPNSVDLITIGEALHRLDQSLILDLVKQWLKPGAYIAIPGLYNIWRGNEIWHKKVAEIIDKWTGYHENVYQWEYRDYELFLKDKGFLNCGSHSFEFPNHASIDSIIGYLYSTSRCSKKALGANTEEFETEIKAELMKINKSGMFYENVRCGYDLGRKPF